MAALPHDVERADAAPDAGTGAQRVPSRAMAQALALGERGQGRTAPNPPVGAVVVRDGEVVGRGFHPRAGAPHAEIYALIEAADRARGADLYVTLEPCPHIGRTPPCTEAIIAAGIRRVVCAAMDPNPVVEGRGIERLRQAGIAVEVGDGAEQAHELLRFYAHHVRTGLPYVVYKYAMSLDGRVSLDHGVPHHLTGPDADFEVHRLRDRVDAVLVGVGTAVTDDPLLTTRLPGGEGRDALRVVVDSHLRLPASTRMLREGASPVLVACRAPAPEARAAALRAAGAEILALKGAERNDAGVPVSGLLQTLGRRGVMSILLEGGPALAGSFARQDMIDEVWAFVSLRLAGGNDGPPALTGVGGPLPKDRFCIDRVRSLGQDLLVVLRRGTVQEEAGPCSPVL